MPSSAPSPAQLAVGAAGGLILIIALTDIFVTIFAYDGFSFLAPKVHRAMWATMRTVTRVLPERQRTAALSLGSALLLPATLVVWLGLETAGFGMVFVPGLAHGAFVVSHGSGTGAGSALYLSGGTLTSLTFGDLTPHSAFYRAMIDLETVVGLATFTLALTYVLSAFDALAKLHSLHARVRRNAIEPHRPSTIIERRYRSGGTSYLSDFLQSVVEDLAGYNEGLRRFPVAFYFHSRRIERSTPRVFTALGGLIELSRWGLPSSEAMTTDPALLALLDEYSNTLNRLDHAFVHHGRETRDELTLPSIDALGTEVMATPDERERFEQMRGEALAASGVEDHGDREDLERRLREWLEFHRASTGFMERLSVALGYGGRT